jgi:hypothetical protein
MAVLLQLPLLVLLTCSQTNMRLRTIGGTKLRQQGSISVCCLLSTCNAGQLHSPVVYVLCIGSDVLVSGQAVY